MDLLTDLVRLLLVIVCAVFFIGAGGWLLLRLSDAADVIDNAPYDWQAEGDFADPAHNPLMAITDRAVVVRCSCGNFTHVEPVKFTTARAYRAAEDEFWSTHNREVAA